MAMIGDATTTVGAEPALLTILRDLADEQRRCREYLGRLVAMEAERREAERTMEALANALMPGAGAAAEIDVDAMPWYRTSGGKSYGVRLPDGSSRQATPDEVAAITASMGSSRRSR